MRLTVFATPVIMKKLFIGLILGVSIATPATALAQPNAFTTDLHELFNQAAPSEPIKTINPPKVEVAEAVPAKAPEPVVYVVVAGDNLTKIGTAHNVEWQRIWSKNASIKHPDVIHIGDRLTIPDASEVLEARALPAVVVAPVVTPGIVAVQKPAPAVGNSGNYSGGNTYDYGYCTWYVKNRRGASLPNSLGNANTWFSRAQAAGMATGYAPRAGAVGTTTRGALGHVVYVDSVNADGSINISEMNAPTFGAVTHRTASAGEFSYIY